MTLPDLESLRCFVAAAHHLSFRRAAKEVALSPAAFSDRMRRLEEQVGERLFLRTTRSIRLSKAGERALPHALAAIAAAKKTLDSGHHPVPFDLVLGTRFELGLSFLSPNLAALAKARPERRMHLYFGDTDALLAALERGEADAIVTSARVSRARVETLALFEEHYGLVAAPDLLARKPLASFRDADAHTLLDLHPDLPLFRYFLDGRPAKEVWRFDSVQRLGTIAAVAHGAREGAGVAVLPRYFVLPDLERGTLVEPMPKAKLASDHFRLLFRSGHPRADDIADLCAELRAFPLK